MTTCNEIMTKDVVCCVPSTPVDMVARLMRVRDIGSVAIVEDLSTNKLVGLITDRDIVLRIVAEGKNPKTLPVEDFMTRRLITCEKDAGVDNALTLMEKHQIRRLPIIDSSGRVTGIIATSDIVSRLRQSDKTTGLFQAILRMRAPIRPQVAAPI